MSFTLHDLGAEGYEFNANVWNWKAALEIVRSLDVISEGGGQGKMTYNRHGA